MCSLGIFISTCTHAPLASSLGVPFYLWGDPLGLRSQATNASRIMFTVGKRAQLVSIEVLPVAEITKGQFYGIRGLAKLLDLLG